MVFPQTPLPLQVDISTDGSTWTDITADARAEQGIHITRGRSDWGQQVDFGRCSLTLTNTTGTYSPRNPSSPYFGQIGRNTPIRVSVNTGSVALDLPGADGDYASTPDTAALDITGDIDVRIDATLVNWNQPDYPSSGQSDFGRTELVAKQASGDLSWALYMKAGRPYFEWSTNGTAITFAWADGDLPLTTSGRIALRVTLDVDNGAGGFTITFYTADTIDGTWTELGSGVGGSTTSIHSGAASLKIGDATDSTVYRPALGLVHAVEVYDGIAGTPVANPDFTAQSSGTTSFADSAGRTWSLAGNAEITNRKVRFSGEVASWTPRWDTGGFDPVIAVEAAGVLRRLGTGSIPTKSPFFREFTTSGRMDAGITAYWPMEDGADTTVLASAYTDHPSVTITGDVTPAAYSDWIASDPIPTIDTGKLKVSIPSYTLNSSHHTDIGFFVKVPAAGVVSTQRLMSLSQTGTSAKWSVYVNTSGNVALRAYDSEGTQILDTGFGSDSINGLEKYVLLTLNTSGANVAYTLLFVDIAGSLTTAVPDDSYSSFTISGTLSSYTTRYVTSVRFGEDGAMNGTAVGHLAIGNASAAFAATVGVMVGWNAEESASRTARIGAEENIVSYPTGGHGSQCGPQPRDTALGIMRSSGDVDAGILAEQRTVLGVRYVTRESVYNEPVTLTLDYETSDGLVAPLDPAEDDQSVTNDVTITRTSGASGRATLETGALSTQAPPDGIGLYDTAATLNLLDDTQPQLLAGWLLHLGTWDEQRFPVVTVNLAADTGAIEDAAAVDVGSRMQITNPPAWLPPDTIDLRVEGYTETLFNFVWMLAFNCSPFGPFNVAIESDGTYDRADTEGSELAASMTSTATTAYVLTTSGPVWTTDGAEYSFPLRIDGEVVTATACTSAASDDFSANQTDSWGSADIGGTWTNSGGASTDYDVAGGVGTHLLTSTNVSRRSTLTSPHADFDIYCDITTSQLATGASLIGSVMARVVDSNNLYMARLEFTTSNTVILTIRERAAGVESTLGTAVTLGFTHVANTYVRTRFQGSGTALRAKAWLTTELEPGPWQVDTTDSTLTAAGSIGCRSIASTGNTNASPIVSFDNFNLVNPQIFTITRSVNGVVKAQSAAADVRLAYAAYTAL